MIKTSKILLDGVDLGKFHCDKKLSCDVARETATKIVVGRYKEYGIESSNDVNIAVSLYMDGVSIGFRGLNGKR